MIEEVQQNNNEYPGEEHQTPEKDHQVVTHRYEESSATLKRKTTKSTEKKLTKSLSIKYHKDFHVENIDSINELRNRLYGIMTVIENKDDYSKFSVEIDYDKDKEFKEKIDLAVEITKSYQILKKLYEIIDNNYTNNYEKIFETIGVTISQEVKEHQEALDLKEANAPRLLEIREKIRILQEEKLQRRNDIQEARLIKDLRIYRIYESNNINSDIHIEELRQAFAEYSSPESNRYPNTIYDNYKSRFKQFSKIFTDYINDARILVNNYEYNCKYLIQSRQDIKVISEYTCENTLSKMNELILNGKKVLDDLLKEMSELYKIELKANYIHNIRLCHDEFMSLQMKRLPLKDMEEEIRAEYTYNENNMRLSMNRLKDLIVAQRLNNISRLQQLEIQYHEAEINKLYNIVRSLQSQINELKSQINALDDRMTSIARSIETISSVSVSSNTVSYTYSRPYANCSSLFEGKGLSTPQINIDNLLDGPEYQMLKAEVNIEIKSLGNYISAQIDGEEKQFLIFKEKTLYYKKKLDYLTVSSERLVFLDDRVATEKAFNDTTEARIYERLEFGEKLKRCINYIQSYKLLEDKIDYNDSINSIFELCNQNNSCCSCFLGNLHYLSDSSTNLKQLKNLAAGIVRKRLNVANSCCTSVDTRLASLTVGDVVDMLKSKKLWVVLNDVCQFESMEIFEKKEANTNKLKSKSKKNILVGMQLNDVCVFWLNNFIKPFFENELKRNNLANKM